MAKRNSTKAEPALLLAKHCNLAKIPREREKKKKSQQQKPLNRKSRCEFKPHLHLQPGIITKSLNIEEPQLP